MTESLYNSLPHQHDCDHDHGHGHGENEVALMFQAHAPHERTRAFPADAENFWLGLARNAAGGVFPYASEVSNGKLDEGSELRDTRVSEIEEEIEAIKARLGEKCPDLSSLEYAGVAFAFVDGYADLPRTHPRYEHSHSHHDDRHDCGKIHGPLRRRFDDFETKVLGRVSNKHIHALAAATFRLGALSVCPGDDLAAIGMQVYGAVSGEISTDEGHDELAILPRRPRIDFVHNRVSLPLDAVASHEALPKTAAGDELRRHIEDSGPEQRLAAAARSEKEAELRSEKRKRRRRVVVLGAAALAVLGMGVGSVAQSTENESVPGYGRRDSGPRSR